MPPSPRKQGCDAHCIFVRIHLGHPVPSGDRAMARMLIRALEMAGHDVTLVSELRVFLRTADAGLLAPFEAQAAAERLRIATSLA